MIYTMEDNTLIANAFRVTEGKISFLTYKQLANYWSEIVQYVLEHGHQVRLVQKKCVAPDKFLECFTEIQVDEVLGVKINDGITVHDLESFKSDIPQLILTAFQETSVKGLKM